jgi:5,10-methylenetetrahydromethanopterin reductase
MELSHGQIYIDGSAVIIVMVLVSIAIEGDKDFQTYRNVAHCMDGAGFYSLQFYEHVPYASAWGLAFAIAPHLKHLKTGPVTVPARLYSPLANARFLVLLSRLGPGAVLGISRGAYMGGERAGITEVVENVEEIASYVMKIASTEPELYVGTSGPKLVKAAASSKAVKAIVVDNLANPRYARYLKNIIEEVGRKDLKLMARPFTYIVPESGKAVEPLLSLLRKYLPDLVGHSPMVEAAGLRYEELLTDDPALKEKILDSFSLYGSAEDVLDRAARLVEAGVDHLCFGHPLSDDLVWGVRAVSERILPYLREMSGG